ncbi:AraC family transcriptional regulator ligand-binding domain-containing protein [Sphingobium sp. AP49]|uniref:AraC family transcriptional regulator n=1 Tax=Sphingobium sp. AP49 TaxID=1144307 RepID=UPI00026ED73C|nr:AraC family transcriptional regulator [Sphingobium sp. AP49]WHO38623.1 AraC family transcriptional regulator ligand-binding domain-containing protein [Sphingobium sp. AP49]
MEEQDYFFGLEGPLEAVPAAGQMRAANLRGFSDYVRARGGAPRRILAQHGLDPLALADPDGHISCQQVAAMFEYCSLLFDDPLFGLHLAATQDADVFGSVTAVCRAAPDLRSAIASLIRYLPVAHSPEAQLDLVEQDGIAELRWAVRADVGFNDQANYQAMMLILLLLRNVSGPRFRPAWVQFSADASAHELVEIEALLGTAARPRAPGSAIGFSAALLDLPIGTANRLTYRLVGGYLGRLRLLNRADMAERARSYVRGALPAGSCTIERCADRLGLSVRTLQSRLAAHDLRFVDLVEEQREQLARIYLRQTPMPIDEVAERLGYAEQTSFGRAFKRWTGQTPRQFRRR